MNDVLYRFSEQSLFCWLELKMRRNKKKIEKIMHKNVLPTPLTNVDLLFHYMYIQWNCNRVKKKTATTLSSTFLLLMRKLFIIFISAFRTIECSQFSFHAITEYAVDANESSLMFLIPQTTLCSAEKKILFHYLAYY